MIKVGKDDDGQRLDRWLKKHLPDAGFGQIQKLLRTGQVRVDGKRVKPDARLVAGQEVRLPPQATLAAPKEEADAKDAAFIRSLVLYEDDYIVALNKPAGLAVQGGTGIKRHIDGMLGALSRDDIPPRLVHRIDRDTSGILMIARTAEMARRMTEAFAGRDVEKTYLAITVPAPKEASGRIDAPLAKGDAGADIEKMLVDEESGKPAITDYEIRAAAPDGSAALVAFHPLTGRTHQIRAHAALTGCPLLGDVKYGGHKDSGGMHLHAAGITLTHPKSGKETTFEAPLPEKFVRSCKKLGIPL